MNSLTRRLLVISLALLVYGYLCRLLHIYFFWDSKAIGWILLVITLLSYWVHLRKKRKQDGKKTIWPTIGICVLVFGLTILPVIIFLLKNSDAYNTAIEYIKSDQTIKDEIGNVKGFGLIPTGAVTESTINGVESGDAIFEIIVRGSRKNKDVTIQLKRAPEKFWTVTDIR